MAAAEPMAEREAEEAWIRKRAAVDVKGAEGAAEAMVVADP